MYKKQSSKEPLFFDVLKENIFLSPSPDKCGMDICTTEFYCTPPLPEEGRAWIRYAYDLANISCCSI